ncbi:MAG: 3-dehydroquinate synthase [Bacteroidales bacterium]
MSKIFFEEEAVEFLPAKLLEFKQEGRSVFWLLDENTRRFCLQKIQKISDNLINNSNIIEIPSGEINKNLSQLGQIWDFLTLSGADRKSVLIVLGGGMLCDLGGFAASVYQRGIETLYIPTTLLAMVDASIGGKTGFDYQNLKNHIGTFYLPKNILIFSDLIESLPIRERNSALAEVIKYGYISRPEILWKMKEETFSKDSVSKIIRWCIEDKVRITTSDPLEQGFRKVLNFGHTLGHAIESVALETGIDVLHGEAVAAGIACELWLSVKMKGLDEGYLNDYLHFLKMYFSPLAFVRSAIEMIVHRTGMDKKNSQGRVKAVLILAPGNPVFDIVLEESLIRESLVFYSSLDFRRSK